MFAGEFLSYQDTYLFSLPIIYIPMTDITFFIDSDAKGMARDVHDTLTDIIVEHGGQTKTEAVQTLTNLMQSKRYLRDLVSVGLFFFFFFPKGRAICLLHQYYL